MLSTKTEDRENVSKRQKRYLSQNCKNITIATKIKLLVVKNKHQKHRIFKLLALARSLPVQDNCVKEAVCFNRKISLEFLITLKH